MDYVRFYGDRVETDWGNEKGSRDMGGFGLQHIKGEGNPLHPDDMGDQMSDETYLRQLQAYKDCYPDTFWDTTCVRSDLLSKIV